MNRRDFHKAVLAGIAAAAFPPAQHPPTASAGESLPPLPHPGDALPPGSTVRLGTNRLWHFAESGNEGLNALAFTHDGRTLAAQGYQDGWISLWEIPSGRMLRKWEADDADRFGDLAFSPDGRLLACCGNGVRVWDLSTGELVRQLHDDNDQANGVAFSPDGRHLATALRLMSVVVEVWDVETGRLAAQFEPDPHSISDQDWEKSDRFQCVAFSQDGLLLAAGTSFPRYYDPRSPEAEVIEDRLWAQRRGLTRRGWHDIMYLEEEYGRVWCWEWTTGRLVAKLEGHTFPVKRVQFAADGRLLSYSDDGAIWAWDVGTGRRVAELTSSTDLAYQTSAEFATDRAHAVLSRTGSLVTINLTDGREVRRFEVEQGNVWRKLAVSCDGRWVATESHGRISLWDGTTGTEFTPPGRHSGGLGSVLFTRDTQRVVTATSGEAMLWDPVAGQLLRTIIPTGSLAPKCLVLSPDGFLAACILDLWGSPKGTVKPRSLIVWDWETGTHREWEHGRANTLAWTADGQYLLIGCEDGTVDVLDLRTERLERCLDGIRGGVEGLAVSADGRLAAALGSASVRVWRWGQSGSVHVIGAAGLPPSTSSWEPRRSLSFSPDGRYMAVTRSDAVVGYGPVNGREMSAVFTPPPLDGERYFTFATGFRPDGRLLAAGMTYAGEKNEDGERGLPCVGWVWDTTTGQELWTSPPQDREWSALAFCPDGRTLATGSYDSTALLWNLPTPHDIAGGEP